MDTMTTGPVITDELFGYQTDGLRREVERRLESEASKAAHSLAGWTTERIRDAYVRGLADGFAQGTLSGHHSAQPIPAEDEEEEPPKGLRYSERGLWFSTDDQRVRDVLGRLSRERLSTQPQDGLAELLKWVDGQAAEERECDPREGYSPSEVTEARLLARTFERVATRIRFLQSSDQKGR